MPGCKGLAAKIFVVCTDNRILFYAVVSNHKSFESVQDLLAQVLQLILALARAYEVLQNGAVPAEGLQETSGRTVY